MAPSTWYKLEVEIVMALEVRCPVHAARFLFLMVTIIENDRKQMYVVISICD